jgi:hypothetical protein
MPSSRMDPQTCPIKKFEITQPIYSTLLFIFCLGRAVPTRSDRRLRSLHRSRRQRFDRRSALLHASRDARVSPAGEHRRRRTSQQQQEDLLQLLVHQEVGGRDGEEPSK